MYFNVRLGKQLGLVCGFVLSQFLVGCGGGGTTTTTSQNPVFAYPSSGNYAWLLTISGTTAAPKMGISLIHPSVKTVEYVIEPTTSAIADTKVVKSGTVDLNTQTVINIKPDSLLYIVAGEVRRLPLVANGVAPASRIKKTGNINACGFTIDANDYANPDQSKFIVSTKGLDATCGTTDDAQMEVALAANAGVSISAPLQKVLGVLGNFSTLNPSGWVMGDRIAWTNTHMIMRAPGGSPIGKVVIGNHKAVIAENNNQLTMWQVNGIHSANETFLNATTTAGTDWQSIGYDANNFYVYRNSGNPISACTPASTWKILKVNIATPAATQLATGTGCIGSASMGVGVLYASVLGATTTTNALVSVNKITGTSQTVQSGALDDLFSMLASSGGIHQMMLSLHLSASPTFAVKMIDETGAVLRTLSSGFPMGLQDAATVNFNNSENRTRFFAATSYSSSVAYRDTAIELYDASTQTATTLGALAGFWPSTLYANIVGSTDNFIGGIATPVSGGTLMESSSKIFSLDVTSANSMAATLTKQ